MTTPSVYEYPDQLETTSSRNDDMSCDNDADRDDDQTTSAEYEILLQEAIESDLKETELTGSTTTSINGVYGGFNTAYQFRIVERLLI